ISAIAIEPTTLHLAPGSPESLTKEDFDTVVAAFDLEKLRKGPVKHRLVRQLKLALLEKACANFFEQAQRRPERRIPFNTFCKEEQAWLDDYALFRSLMEVNRNREGWDQWPDEHRDLTRSRAWLETLPPAKRTRINARIDFYQFVQWIAHSQWLE